MRLTLPFLLLLAACSSENSPAPPYRALYAGEGRDRLCIAGERAGFIVYGAGNSNCSVRGRVEKAGEGLLAIIPEGDEDCRIEARQASGSIVLGKRAEACAYYCGPDADFSGRSFREDAAATPAADLAGDPLC